MSSSESNLTHPLSEENLNTLNRQLPALSSRRHKRNRHLPFTVSHNLQRDKRERVSTRQYIAMLHENMENRKADESNQTPPASPRPVQLPFNGDVDMGNEEPILDSPATPRLPKRSFLNYQDAEDKNTDFTYPSRPPSRKGTISSFLSGALSNSRPTLKHSFLDLSRSHTPKVDPEPFIKPDRKESSDSNGEEENKDEEGEVYKFLYSGIDKTAKFPSLVSLHPLGTNTQSALSSPLIEVPLPSYPTKTPFDSIPTLKEKSLIVFKHITDVIMREKDRLPLSDAQQDQIFELLYRWRIILFSSRIVHTPLSESVPKDPKYFVPRHGDTTYAFTRHAVAAAYSMHGSIYRRLIQIASGIGIEDIDVEGWITKMVDVNARYWRNIETAWESDKANEVSGTSWCYGMTDWSRADMPVAIDWSGGEKMAKMKRSDWGGEEVPEKEEWGIEKLERVKAGKRRASVSEAMNKGLIQPTMLQL